jgi:acetyl esterase
MKARDRAFRALVRQPVDLLRRLAGAPIVVDGQTLDVRTQLMLDAMRRLKIVQPDDVALARKQTDEDGAAVAPIAPEMAIERDVLIPNPRDAKTGAMRARVCVPKTARGKPGMLVYLHGGGFVTGSIVSHDPSVKMLAHESGVVVCAIEYRLGPDDMFPAAVQDSLLAYEWAREHAGDFGADASRVGVGGDSAGGNLAAIVCHLAKRKPTHQFLIYPAIDWWRTTKSHETFARGYFLEEERTFWYEKRYLNRIEERDDPRASPIKFTDFSTLPPATIVTAGFDVLRDEGLAYAETLARAKIRVDYTCETSLIHGFFNMSGAIDLAHAACSRIAARVAQELGGVN